jgi:hypothetical protein
MARVEEKTPTRRMAMALKKKAGKGSAKTVGCWKIGQAYLIRGVTNYYLGKLVGVTETDFVLAEASWVADTGRFSEAVTTGKLNEVEMYAAGTLVNVNRGSYCDASEWRHALPTSTI